VRCGATRRRVLGDTHPATILSLGREHPDTLTLAYFNKGKVDKAIEIQVRTVSLLSESTTL
jgi:hypothetical protein